MDCFIALRHAQGVLYAVKLDGKEVLITMSNNFEQKKVIVAQIKEKFEFCAFRGVCRLSRIDGGGSYGAAQPSAARRALSMWF